MSREQLPDDGAWRGWVTLTPGGGGEEGRVARQAAALLDARVAELGALAGEQQPAWAARLGPVPDDAAGRLVWQERAGVVAAWREYAAFPEEDPASIGPEPIGAQPMPRMLWRAAHQALGAPDDTPAWSRVPAVLLSEAVQRGRDAVAAAPAFVDAPRWAAHRLLYATRVELSLAGEQHGQLQQPAPDPGHDTMENEAASDQLREQVAHLQARAAGQQKFLDRMDARADARDRWWLANRNTLAQAQRAARELARRSRHGGTLITRSDEAALPRWTRLRRAAASRSQSDAGQVWRRLRQQHQVRAAEPAVAEPPPGQPRRGLRP